jgi:flavin-dependent dehydrogenase
VSTAALEVVVLDRSRYDEQIAQRALSWGVELRMNARVSDVRESRAGVKAKAGDEVLEGKYYVDATGPSAAHRRGVLAAAKYEIEADWVLESAVEVFLDAEKYPGFFVWVIPYGPRLAKVGAAGRGINAFDALDAFLSSRPHRRLRRVAAPIYVGGPVKDFVSGRTVRVGESAGQVKPTTAGGIMTSIAGAVIGARWLSDSIQLREPSKLANYQPDWDSRFLKEMKNMLRLRSVFEKLSNTDLDSVISVVSSSKLLTTLSQSDFDFHASAILGALGVSGLLRIASAVASAEARSLLSGA